MKLILKRNYIPLLYVITILLFSWQVDCYSKSNSQFSLTTQKSSSSLPRWPSKLEETITAFSRLSVCQTPDCRTHDEVRNLAICKAEKLASLLPSSITLSYAETTFQGRAKNEWTKFTYLISDSSNNDTSVSFGVKHLRVCVPIDKSLDAWVDDRCFFDDCDGPFEYHEKCIKKLPGCISIADTEHKAEQLISRITSILANKNDEKKIKK